MKHESLSILSKVSIVVLLSFTFLGAVPSDLFYNLISYLRSSLVILQQYNAPSPTSHTIVLASANTEITRHLGIVTTMHLNCSLCWLYDFVIQWNLYIKDTSEILTFSGLLTGKGDTTN